MVSVIQWFKLESSVRKRVVQFLIGRQVQNRESIRQHNHYRPVCIN